MTETATGLLSNTLNDCEQELINDSAGNNKTRNSTEKKNAANTSQCLYWLASIAID